MLSNISTPSLDDITCLKCVCMMHGWALMHSYVCMSVRRPELDARCLPESPSTSFSESESLPEPSEQQAPVIHLSSLGKKMGTSVSSFLQGSWKSEFMSECFWNSSLPTVSSPQACISTALITKSVPKHCWMCGRNPPQLRTTQRKHRAASCWSGLFILCSQNSKSSSNRFPLRKLPEIFCLICSPTTSS